MRFVNDPVSGTTLVSSQTEKVPWSAIIETDILLYDKYGKELCDEESVIKIKGHVVHGLPLKFLKELQKSNTINETLLKPLISIVNEDPNKTKIEEEEKEFKRELSRALTISLDASELVFERHVTATYLKVIQKPPVDLSKLKENGNVEHGIPEYYDYYKYALKPDGDLYFHGISASCFIFECKRHKSTGRVNIGDIPSLLLIGANSLKVQRLSIQSMIPNFNLKSKIHVPSVMLGLFSGSLFRLFIGVLREKKKSEVPVFQELVTLNASVDAIRVFRVLKLVRTYLFQWYNIMSMINNEEELVLEEHQRPGGNNEEEDESRDETEEEQQEEKKKR